MLVHLLLRLSTLSLGISYVVCSTPQQQSQLATLHERMNQMISALYSSPLLSKSKAATLSEEVPESLPESIYSLPPTPAPQVVYVSPPSYFEAGSLPNNFGYPLPSNPPPRASFPYSFEYGSYQPQLAPPVYSSPFPRLPYPEYARSSYPQLPAPQPISLPLPYSMPFGSIFPSPQYSNPSPFPLYQSGYPLAPSLPYRYPPAPAPFPGPLPPSYPPSLSYAPSLQTPYPSLPQQFAPSLPQQFAPSLPYPTPYPQSITLPYSPSLPYPPQAIYQPPFPSPFDIQPQPQYEYSS